MVAGSRNLGNARREALDRPPQQPRLQDLPLIAIKARLRRALRSVSSLAVDRSSQLEPASTARLRGAADRLVITHVATDKMR